MGRPVAVSPDAFAAAALMHLMRPAGQARNLCACCRPDKLARGSRGRLQAGRTGAVCRDGNLRAMRDAFQGGGPGGCDERRPMPSAYRSLNALIFLLTTPCDVRRPMPSAYRSAAHGARTLASAPAGRGWQDPLPPRIGPTEQNGQPALRVGEHTRRQARLQGVKACQNLQSAGAAPAVRNGGKKPPCIPGARNGSRNVHACDQRNCNNAVREHVRL